MYSRLEVAACAKRIGKSVPTVWRWIREGCRIDDPRSVRAFIAAKQLRKTNVQKARERRGTQQEASPRVQGSRRARSEPVGNGELPLAGRRGAAAALERLEIAEERAHARLERALLGNDAVQIQACQDFWLKCSETLRRLDLAVEVARRQEEVQIPLKMAQAAVLYAGEWMRIAITQFLSAEITSLVAIKDPNEFKAYFFSRFKGVLDLTIKGADKTRSAVPAWAKESLELAWHLRIDP